MMSEGTLPNTLRSFIPEPMQPHESQPDLGVDSYQKATPDSHSRSSTR